ncbi:Gustatory receptor 8, partial [Frankliniella occidentalis]
MESRQRSANCPAASTQRAIARTLNDTNYYDEQILLGEEIPRRIRRTKSLSGLEPESNVIEDLMPFFWTLRAMLFLPLSTSTNP